MDRPTSIESLAREVQALRDKLALAEGRADALQEAKGRLDTAIIQCASSLVLMGEPDWVDDALKKAWRNNEDRDELLRREAVVAAALDLRRARDAALRDFLRETEVSRG